MPAIAPITTAPATFPNYMGTNNTSAPIPTATFTNDANKASWAQVYGPEPFADGTYRQPWTGNATTEGFIIYAPNQPLGSKPIARFNGISVDNMDVGSTTVTSALNNINRLNNMVDQQVAFSNGLKVPDPFTYLYADPTKGGLPNVNGTATTSPTFAP